MGPKTYLTLTLCGLVLFSFCAMITILVGADEVADLETHLKDEELSDKDFREALIVVSFV